MAYRLAPQAEADLEDVAFYLFVQTGSLEIADRLIQSVTERFDLLAAHPRAGRAREDLHEACAGSPSASMSFCTGSKVTTSWSFVWCTAAAISTRCCASEHGRARVTNG